MVDELRSRGGVPPPRTPPGACGGPTPAAGTAPHTTPNSSIAVQLSHAHDHTRTRHCHSGARWRLTQLRLLGCRAIRRAARERAEGLRAVRLARGDHGVELLAKRCVLGPTSSWRRAINLAHHQALTTAALRTNMKKCPRATLTGNAGRVQRTRPSTAMEAQPQQAKLTPTRRRW